MMKGSERIIRRKHQAKYEFLITKQNKKKTKRKACRDIERNTAAKQISCRIKREEIQTSVHMVMFEALIKTFTQFSCDVNQRSVLLTVRKLVYSNKSNALYVQWLLRVSHDLSNFAKFNIQKFLWLMIEIRHILTIIWERHLSAMYTHDTLDKTFRTRTNTYRIKWNEMMWYELKISYPLQEDVTWCFCKCWWHC